MTTDRIDAPAAKAPRKRTATVPTKSPIDDMEKGSAFGPLLFVLVPLLFLVLYGIFAD